MKLHSLKRKFRLLTIVVSGVLCSTGQAIENRNFVEANILGIFYHELGHALIDIEDVPIFGQEEDAADTFSIFLIDALFDEETAEALAYDAAIGFWAEAELREKSDETLLWWDVHSPDEQRFYNTVCLFYGADPDNREQYAEELGLPEERAEYCAEEFEQANASWGALYDELLDRGAGKTLTLDGNSNSLIFNVLKPEIQALNDALSLDRNLSVAVRKCDQANAFYDPQATEIVMCTEFVSHLDELAQ